MATKQAPHVDRYQRVNITLPQSTLTLIDKVKQTSNRSAFLDRAARFYVEQAGRENLKKRLREGAQARQDRDRNVAEDWFPIESDA